jgi:RNA polymerase sigma-70 factor (ECF subfamily)
MVMQAELVARAQRGDREAFSVLAHGASPRLYATARLILRHPDRAEDAVQDALIEAWRDIRGLRDPDRLDAWLHRPLVRACHRHVRGRSTGESLQFGTHARMRPTQ